MTSNCFAVDDEPVGAGAPRDLDVAGLEEAQRLVAALVGPVLLRVGDVAGRRDRDVDGHAGGDLVARLGVGEDDVAARDVLAQRRDQARRERARRACVRRAPVRRGMHSDREHEQRRRPGGELRPLERDFVFQKHKPDDERGDPAADREPGHEGRAALLEPVGELARVGELQRDPADERRRAGRAHAAAPPARRSRRRTRTRAARSRRHGATARSRSGRRRPRRAAAPASPRRRRGSRRARTPPSGCRSARPASGTKRSAATATAPARPNTSGASR